MKPDVATRQGPRFLPYGLVNGFELELGYFSFKELQEVRDLLGLQIERDLHYEPKSLRELTEWHKTAWGIMQKPEPMFGHW